MKNTILYYQQGNSDKVYKASIETQAGGYIVNYAYGRRGTSLQTGTKTSSPVSFDEAEMIHAKLVNSKLSKGYRIDRQNGERIDVEAEPRLSGITCQLLNPIEESEVDGLLADDGVCAQEKYDGVRMLVQRDGENLRAINRKGLFANFEIPSEVKLALLSVPTKQFLIDGEGLGANYAVFDILKCGRKDVRDLPYRDRLALLEKTIISRLPETSPVFGVSSHTSQATKSALIDRVRDQNGEGVVFKALSAPYTEGRPASAGTQRKYKFYESASVVVNEPNSGKRSVAIVAFDDDKIVPLGSVTIPPNHPVPGKGDVVEVRYLYAFKGGSLAQPVYLGTRSDIGASECTTDQLKYRKVDAASILRKQLASESAA